MAVLQTDCNNLNVPYFQLSTNQDTAPGSAGRGDYARSKGITRSDGLPRLSEWVNPLEQALRSGVWGYLLEALLEQGVTAALTPPAARPGRGGAVLRTWPAGAWRSVQMDFAAWNWRDLFDEPMVRLILHGTAVRLRLDRQATSLARGANIFRASEESAENAGKFMGSIHRPTVDKTKT